MITEDIKYHFQLEEYLKGSLSANEMLEINEKRNSDPIFDQQIKQYSLANEAINQLAKAELKSSLNKYHTVFENREVNKSNWIKTSTVLLGFISLIVASVYYLKSEEKQSIVSEAKTKTLLPDDTLSIQMLENEIKQTNKKEKYKKSVNNVIDLTLEVVEKEVVDTEIEEGKESIIDTVVSLKVVQIEEKKKAETEKSTELKPETAIPESTSEGNKTQHEKIEFSFNPDQNEHWEYPDFVNKHCEIVILTKGGVVVFSDKNCEPHKVWQADGLQQGTYLVQIYCDQKIVQKGYITIIK